MPCQFAARVLEDIQILENAASPDGCLPPPPLEVPVVLIDAEHTLKSSSVEEMPSTIPGNEEESQREKYKIENEMDPADISNVSNSSQSFPASGTHILGRTQK